MVGGDDRDAGADHHGVALDDQFVDLIQQCSGQPASAGQPDPGAVLLLQLANQAEGVGKLLPADAPDGLPATTTGTVVVDCVSTYSWTGASGRKGDMRNAERRAALVDAAIEVLADQGARGLTFRAVDTRAGVPAGTTSNYFTSRDELFTQAGGRIYQRLTPDAVTLASGLSGLRDRQRVVELVHELTERIAAYRTG